MNVLYLINHAGKAGTERYIQSLVEKLNGNKINAHLAYNEEGLLCERMKAIGVQTHRIEMKNPFDIGAAIKLANLCKKLDIDLIHTQFLRENYIALWSRIFNPKVKVMYTNHFIMQNNAPTRFFNRLLTRLESNIIAVCNKGKEVLIQNGMPREKITVIFNGVDPEMWGREEKSTLREELKVDQQTFIMFCGSRFAHDKGHKFLIDSIPYLMKLTNRDFRLVLSNDGPLLEGCKQQVKDLGIEDKVKFIGFRKDIKNLYLGSDLYINSSEHEALSFAIIEVLASGLPVIATNMGGNPDIINEQTKCGMLVEYNDPEGLAKAVCRMMEDEELRQEYRKNAFKAVRERFSLDNMVNKAYELYVKSLS